MKSAGTYGIERSTTYSIFHETSIALRNALPSISIHTGPDEYSFSARQFRIMIQGPMYGTIAVLDEIAIETLETKLGETPDHENISTGKASSCCACRQRLQLTINFCWCLYDMLEGRTTSQLSKQQSYIHSLRKVGICSRLKKRRTTFLLTEHV